MNAQTIENLITSNNETCPELVYSNPLLDKDVSCALSKSFMKMLTLSKENSNKKLRYMVLENIRNTCKVEPNGHFKVDEDFTELLISYFEQINKSFNDYHEEHSSRELDMYWFRNSLDTPSIRSPITPEVVQALFNLIDEPKKREAFVKDVFAWDPDDKKCMKFLKDHWRQHEKLNFSEISIYRQFIDDASIKIKSEIEELLINVTCEILEDSNANIDEIFNRMDYKTLIQNSAISKVCFSVCIRILTTLFIMNNFYFKIQDLIQIYLTKVKAECKVLSIYSLYPDNLSYVALGLGADVDINLNDDFKVLLQHKHAEFVKTCLDCLTEKHKGQFGSEFDLILLLTHYPKWISVYFNPNKTYPLTLDCHLLLN